MKIDNPNRFDQLLTGIGRINHTDEIDNKEDNLNNSSTSINNNNSIAQSSINSTTTTTTTTNMNNFDADIKIFDANQSKTSVLYVPNMIAKYTFNKILNFYSLKSKKTYSNMKIKYLIV